MCKNKNKNNFQKELSTHPSSSSSSSSSSGFIYLGHGVRGVSRSYPRANPMIIHFGEMRLVRRGAVPLSDSVHVDDGRRVRSRAAHDVDVGRRHTATTFDRTRLRVRYDATEHARPYTRGSTLRLNGTTTHANGARLSLATNHHWIDRPNGTDGTMSGRYSRKNNDGVRAKRRRRRRR